MARGFVHNVAAGFYQTTTGIGSTSTLSSADHGGMTTTLSGSTPRRHRPRSAASPGDIATTGSSCSNSFNATSGH